MRKTHLVVLVGGVVLLAGALTAWQAIDLDRHRAAMQTAIANQLGRQVALGPMHLTVIPFGVTVDNVTIAEDPSFQTGRPFVHTAALDLSLRPLPLLRGRVDVRALTLRHPAIELVRSARGAWNVASLVRGDLDASVRVDRFSVRDGEIALTDVTDRVLYRAVNVDVRQFATVRPFDVAVTATLPGGAAVSGTASVANEAGCVSARGALRLERGRVDGVDFGYPVAATFDAALEPDSRALTIHSATIHLGAAPVTLDGTVVVGPGEPRLDVHAVASGVPLSEAARLAPVFGLALAPGTRVEGRLSVDARVTGAMRRPAFAGHARLSDVVVSGAGLRRPVRAPALDLRLTPDEIRSGEFQAGTDGTPIAARFAIRGYATPKPSVDATVHTAGVDLADVLTIANTWGLSGGAAGINATGRVTLDVRAAGPLEDPAFSGAASVDGVRLKTTGVVQPLEIGHADLTFSGAGAAHIRAPAVTYGRFELQNVESDVAFKDRVIRFDPLTAGLFGGHQRGSMSIDGRRAPTLIVVSSELQRLDANRLLTALGIQDVVYGSLQSIVHVSFVNAGDIARTLNGTMAFSIPNGRIAHVDVLHEAGAIARFLAGQPPRNPSTSVTALSGSLTIKDGVASTNNLVATLEGGRVAATGSISLVSQGLNLRTTVVLSRSFSRMAGATTPGQMLGTVLANQQGDLVVPMLVTGTLREPLFAPDPTRIAEMHLRRLLPTLHDPHGLSIGGGRAPVAEPTIEDLLRQILSGAATKKKPPRR